MEIKLIKYPTDEDWQEVKRRALITMYGKGLGEVKQPPEGWKHRILRARHSPIRYLMYSYMMEGIPSNTATHLCRHVHAQPYVSSLRNDRQNYMNGDEAPRNTPVNLIYDCNAEELLTIANKRLCNLASEKTREVVKIMCLLALDKTPELEGLLIPQCRWLHGCPEMFSCGMMGEWKP